MNAALERYPESSRIEIKKKSNKIFGRKIITEPTPFIIPSTKNETVQVGRLVRLVLTNSPVLTISKSIKFIKGFASVYVNSNKRYIAKKNMKKPNTL
jgi:hypothetical protein